MSQLRLFLLGPPQVKLNGNTLAINRRKVLALLAYLASSQRAHQRDHLATLLWSGYDQSSARANLRKTLSLLKQQLDEERLDIQREQIALVRGDDFWLDTDHFKKLIKGCILTDPTITEVTPSCVDALNRAAALYRDDFLAGFSLPDAPEFTDWQLFQAENYRRSLAQLFETLSRGYASQEEWEPALTFARRWLALDTLEEAAHRKLMRLLASKGQRSAALVQYEQCRTILADELEVEPSAETTALYEELRHGAFGRAQPPASTHAPPLPTPRISLPAQLTNFVGREQEVAEITRLLVEESACRHVTLFGPGGVGKTRLAIKAAAEAGHAFSDGAAFVSLASLSHVDGLVPAVAKALGLELSGRKPTKHLLNYLRSKVLLLVLDNFEHLISSRGNQLLSDILLMAPGVKLLVTSRQRLNQEQEWSIEVRGMSLPPAAEYEPVALEQYEAIQLFLGRARRVRQDFTLSQDNRSAVIRICRLVAGMPLGIELAVGWLRLLSCQEIALEIERSLDFLSRSYANRSQRHHSMRTVFEYSWQLLPAEEQRLLGRLSVFRGGFTDRAAQRVTGATLPLLAALVDNALVRRTRSRRYQMHELLRQFAAEKLDEDVDDKERIRQQHAEYYLTFVQQRIDRWGEPPQKEILDVLVPDMDNIWAAWTHALSWKNSELLGKTADGLVRLCHLTGWTQKAAWALQQAVEMVSELEDALALGRLLRGFGDICVHLGDLDLANELLEQSISLLRQVDSGLQVDLAFSLFELANCYWTQGNYLQTEKYAQESLALFAKSQDRYFMGLSMQMLAWIATYTGEYDKAVEYLEESERLFQLDTPGIRRAPGSFRGIVARLRGEYTQAQRYLEEIHVYLREAGGSMDIGYILREFGYLNIALGHYALAKAQFEEGVDLCKKWEARHLYLFLGTGLGYIARLQGEFEQAERLHEEALAISLEIGERRGAAVCLDNLGRLAHGKGAYGEAKMRFLESLQRYQEMGHRHGQASVLCQLGMIALSVGPPRCGEAERRLRQALRISTEIGATPLILEVLRGFALLWTTCETSDTDQAKTLELLSLILNHPASEQETKDNAQRLWDKLAAELPAEVLNAAKERAGTGDVATIAKEILNQALGEQVTLSN